jgi:hypothetical protein
MSDLSRVAGPAFCLDLFVGWSYVGSFLLSPVGLEARSVCLRVGAHSTRAGYHLCVGIWNSSTKRVVGAFPQGICFLEVVRSSDEEVRSRSVTPHFMGWCDRSKLHLSHDNLSKRRTFPNDGHFQTTDISKRRTFPNDGHFQTTDISKRQTFPNDRLFHTTHSSTRQAPSRQVYPYRTSSRSFQ